MSHSQKQIVITTSELVTCFNRVLSVKECQSLFETSANAHHFRQSLSLAIYLTQKNENMMNARTALVQSAELLDTVLKTDLVSLYRHSHNHQSTATSNHSMSTKKLKIELLKLYEHILVVIEQCNATIIEEQKQQQIQQHHHQHQLNHQITLIIRLLSQSLFRYVFRITSHLSILIVSLFVLLVALPIIFVLVFLILAT